MIFAKATCIKRAQKRVIYEGPNTSGEMEYDECLWPSQKSGEFGKDGGPWAKTYPVMGNPGL